MTIIPVLLKLFSSIFYLRVSGRLNELQPPEQGGFRRVFSCKDVTHILHMIAEKAEEWAEEVWIVSLDLEKAFDKVFHSSAFGCLEETGIDKDIARHPWQIHQQSAALEHIDNSTVGTL